MTSFTIVIAPPETLKQSKASHRPHRIGRVSERSRRASPNGAIVAVVSSPARPSPKRLPGLHGRSLRGGCVTAAIGQARACMQVVGTGGTQASTHSCTYLIYHLPIPGTLLPRHPPPPSSPSSFPNLPLVHPPQFNLALLHRSRLGIILICYSSFVPKTASSRFLRKCRR